MKIVCTNQDESLVHVYFTVGSHEDVTLLTSAAFMMVDAIF